MSGFPYFQDIAQEAVSIGLAPLGWLGHLIWSGTGGSAFDGQFDESGDDPFSGGQSADPFTNGTFDFTGITLISNGFTGPTVSLSSEFMATEPDAATSVTASNEATAPNPFPAPRPMDGTLNSPNLIASTGSTLPSASNGLPDGAQIYYGGNSPVEGLPPIGPIDTEALNGQDYMHYQVSLDGMTYDVFRNDMPGGGQPNVTIVAPALSAAPAAALPAGVPTAQPTLAQPPGPPPAPGGVTLPTLLPTTPAPSPTPSLGSPFDFGNFLTGITPSLGGFSPGFGAQAPNLNFPWAPNLLSGVGGDLSSLFNGLGSGLNGGLNGAFTTTGAPPAFNGFNDPPIFGPATGANPKSLPPDPYGKLAAALGALAALESVIKNPKVWAEVAKSLGELYNTLLWGAPDPSNPEVPQEPDYRLEAPPEGPQPISPGPPPTEPLPPVGEPGPVDAMRPSPELGLSEEESNLWEDVLRDFNYVEELLEEITGILGSFIPPIPTDSSGHLYGPDRPGGA